MNTAFEGVATETPPEVKLNPVLREGAERWLSFTNAEEALGDEYPSFLAACVAELGRMAKDGTVPDRLRVGGKGDKAKGSLSYDKLKFTGVSLPFAVMAWGSEARAFAKSTGFTVKGDVRELVAAWAARRAARKQG